MKAAAKRAKQTTSKDVVDVVTIAIPVSAAHLKMMRRIAKRDHEGDLSAAFAAVLADKERFEAMDEFLGKRPTPTPEEMTKTFAELLAPPAPPPRVQRAKKGAKRAAA